MKCLAYIGVASGSRGVGYLNEGVDNEPIQLFWLLGITTCTFQPEGPRSDPESYNNSLGIIPSFRVNTM